jgi:hypothetical protein
MLGEKLNFAEVLIPAVTMHGDSCDITASTTLETNQYFGRTRHLELLRTIHEARNMLQAHILLSLILRP